MNNFGMFYRVFNLDGGTGGAGAAAGAGAGDGGAGGSSSAGASPGGGGGDLASRAAQIASGQGAQGQGQQGNAQPGQGQPAQGQQSQQAADGKGGLYTPEGLAENYRGKTDQETIDKLLADVNGRPKPPAKPSDYKFQPGEDFSKKFGDLKDDPVLPAWAEVAHELGLDNKQFQDAVPKLYEKLSKAGLIEGPVDYDAELEKLAPKEGDKGQRIIKAADRVNAISSFVRGLETRKEITREEATLLSTMYHNAAAVTAFEKVLAAARRGEHGLQGGGQGYDAGGYTWDKADADMSDPRYSTSSPKYEPKFRKEADERMARLAPRGQYRRS